MRYKRIFATLAVLMAICTAAYAVNIQGLLMNAGIVWSGDTLRTIFPIDLDEGWEIDGTTVTATAVELNAVTGNVTAVQAQPNALKVVRTFTETAGAGTYTATVSVPAGYTILNMDWINAAVWNNTTSATMDVGDNDDPDGYFDGVDVKATPAAAARLSSLPNVPGGSYGVYCGAPKAYAGAKTITATVVTVHAVGDTGRSTLIVEMVKTANAVAAATKA